MTVSRGPTPIPGGDAVHADDITLQNGLFAVSFAVTSRPPWGVARGGIVDLAVIRDGDYSEDLVSLVDFLPDSWSNWPSSYQDVEVVEAGPDRGVIRVERDWHEVVLVSTFALERDSDVVHVQTQMTNEGDQTFEDLLSGYAVWAEGGFQFDRPADVDVTDGSAHQALTDWTASYGADWALAFHAPYADHVIYDGRDQYRKISLQPGQSVEFEGWLQVIPRGEVAPALAFEARRKDLPTGTVQGSVASTDGVAIDHPVIMIEKRGKAYAWSTGSDGRFEFDLPEGRYKVYAMAQNHSAGATGGVEVLGGETRSLEFADLEGPGRLKFSVRDKASGKPLDAKLEIVEGARFPVGYLAAGAHFTGLDEIGEASIELAPGRYTFRIGHGDGFISEASSKQLEVASGVGKRIEVDLERRFHPAGQHWYAVDLHHHSDVLDGISPPSYVMRSQLAAGLDLIFLSDHDSTANHRPMKSLAAARGMPFVPSMEVSPSWGHFNAWPLEIGAELDIDPSTATVGGIFDAVIDKGAEVIVVNHPFIAFGYFTTLEDGSAPGGFDPRFDLVELSGAGRNERELERLHSFWDRDLRVYISAGSDTHDVWNGRSGAMRMMVYIPGGASVDGLVQSLKSGHAYATGGPLIEPDHMFGSQIRIGQGDALELPFRVMAVNGLNQAVLVGSGGEIVEQVNLDDAGDEHQLNFTVRPGRDGWYALMVEDRNGRWAFTNPVWVSEAAYD